MQQVSRRAVVAGILATPVAAKAAWAAKVCPSASAALDAVSDRLLTEMPELAVYNGVPAAMGGSALQRRLDDYSPAGEASLRNTLRSTRTSLNDIDCPSGSPDMQHVAVARAVLDNGLRSADIPYGHIRPLWFSGHEPYVVSQISGPHIDSANQMIAQQSVRSVVEAQAYVAKLRDFRRALGGAAAKMRADARAGCTPPAALMPKTIAVINEFVAPKPADHSFVAALVRKMTEAGIDQSERNRFAEAAEAAVRDHVYPAYSELRRTVVELAGKARKHDGLWAQPRGDELYAANVANLGDTTRSPAEIHQLGLNEVARITAQMDSGLKRQGYRSGSVGERMNALADEARFLYPDSEAGRAALLADLNGMIERVQALQPRFLSRSTIPIQTVEVRRVPAANEGSSPGGYYDGPSLDGSRPGIFWINLQDMKAVARFRLPTLTYHEAVPGHHLQAAVQLKQGDVPLLVKLASFNAYAEGWALYAERLASELGLYADDPFGDLGRLQDELFRAVRLVVDSGMHFKRWSRQQAIDYMSRTTGIAPSRVTAEIERYMAWPGQALGYKLGQLRLLELREQAKTAMGRRFDLRGYHDAVLLNGPAPLSIIAKAVADWSGARA